MKKILLYLIITCNILFAYTYERQILQIHAKIAPRILLMSERHISEDIRIVIVYEEGDEDSALLFQSYLKKSYPKGLSNRSLNIKKIDYSSFSGASKDSLVFLFDGEDFHINKVVNFAKKDGFLTMSYRDDCLEKGVLVSLHVGKSLKPYLNIRAAKKSGIIFQNSLIAISKIFYPKEQP